MAKSESVQDTLKRVRAARVNLDYKVETNGAIEVKELPFVVGVIADLGGNPAVETKRIKDRNFVRLDRDNFDAVMGGVAPVVSFRVPNKLSTEGGQMAVNLQFKEMADFRPEAVVSQVEPLRRLLEARAKLADLRNKVAGNEKLEDLLSDVLNSTEKLADLRQCTKKGD